MAPLPRLFLAAFLTLPLRADEMPEAFVAIDDTAPGIAVEARYFTTDNFVGARIDGYEAPRCYLTRPAAAALSKADAALAPFGLGLKVFDCYRPQRAVDHFVRWAKDLGDTKMKARYYPRVAKNVLFKEGYIAARSGHSRGSTVDLTLIDRESGSELDMGTGFDFFGPESWPSSMAVTAQQRANRLLLRSVMTRAGFRPLQEEWWHFTLEDEPFPERYFDFPVR
ncbi:M15 family metallopeptidase [Sulfurimonas sp. HSL1-2]|uniref:M15 family metallopeptidase n=1 Tax=Thiomicrolovo zhangzhouensis TaxID=3131933 RepID=UPI0031F85AED